MPGNGCCRLLGGGVDSGNGTVVIPFECEDVPEKAVFLYAIAKLDKSKKINHLIIRALEDNSLFIKFIALDILDKKKKTNLNIIPILEKRLKIEKNKKVIQYIRKILF